MTFLETYQFIKESPDTIIYKGDKFGYEDGYSNACFINEDFYFVSLHKKDRIGHWELSDLFTKLLKYERGLVEAIEEEDFEFASELRTYIKEIKEQIDVYPDDGFETLNEQKWSVMTDKGRIFNVKGVNIFTYWSTDDSKIKSIVNAEPFYIMLDVLDIDPNNVLVELSELEDKDNPLGTTMVPLSDINKNLKQASEEDKERSRRIQELQSLIHTSADPIIKKRAKRELEELGLRGDNSGNKKIKDPLYWNQYSRMSESVCDTTIATNKGYSIIT